MQLVNALQNEWNASIPAQVPGTMIYYYIEGNAVNGKTQVRPITAPAGYWKFKVLDSITGLNESNRISSLGNPFPNPGRALTCIPYEQMQEGMVRATLLDAMGREAALIFEGHLPEGKKNFFVDCAELNAGVYFVRVNSPDGVFSKPLLVKK